MASWRDVEDAAPEFATGHGRLDDHLGIVPAGIGDRGG